VLLVVSDELQNTANVIAYSFSYFMTFINYKTIRQLAVCPTFLAFFKGYIGLIYMKRYIRPIRTYLPIITWQHQTSLTLCLSSVLEEQNFELKLKNRTLGRSERHLQLVK
jgi:hypothetical protein